MPFRPLVLPLLLCAAALPARADLLFLAFNPAPGEIRAAREAARARGEELHVLPRMTPAQERRLREIDDEEAKLIRRSTRTTSDAEIEKLTARTLELMEEEERLLAAISVDEAALTEELRALDRRGVRLSAVVVSGHDGNGKFWGAIGQEMTSRHMQNAFGAVPRIAGAVRAVALLGCYTTNIGSLDTHWRAVFPGAKAFGGYEKKGPLAHVPAGHDYLKAFLARADNFAQAKTKDEMLKLFRGLPQIRSLAASVATDGFHVSHQGARTIEELYESCRGLNADSERRRRFTCHYEAAPGCENVPSDTRGGPIRQFYEELQTHAHCKEMLSVDADHSLPAPEAVLSLIFFANVEGNFKRLHRTELQELDAWLEESGAAPLQLATRERSRARLMTDLRAARTALLTPVPASEGLKGRFLARAKAAERLADADRILLTLVPACVPSAWVDPGVSARSVCLTPAATLEKRAEQAWAKAREAAP